MLRRRLIRTDYTAVLVRIDCDVDLIIAANYDVGQASRTHKSIELLPAQVVDPPWLASNVPAFVAQQGTELQLDPGNH